MAGASKRLSSSSSSSSSKSIVKIKPESKSAPKKTGVTPSTKSTIKNVKTVSNSNPKKTNSKTTTIGLNKIVATSKAKSKSKVLSINQRGGVIYGMTKFRNFNEPMWKDYFDGVITRKEKHVGFYIENILDRIEGLIKTHSKNLDEDLKFILNNIYTYLSNYYYYDENKKIYYHPDYQYQPQQSTPTINSKKPWWSL